MCTHDPKILLKIIVPIILSHFPISGSICVGKVVMSFYIINISHSLENKI